MRTSTKSKTTRKAFLGLDLHSATTVLVVLNASGKLLSTQRFATTGRNLIDAVAAVRATDKRVVVEETPMTHWAIETLRPWCTRIVSSDPKQNRWISRNTQKCDETDAERLAELLRLGRLKEVYHTHDSDRFAFKAAVQHYLDVQRDRVRAKNKIKALFKRVGLTSIDGACAYSKKYRPVLLDIVPEHGNWRLSLQRLYRHYDWLHAEVRQALREVQTQGKGYWEIPQFQRMTGVGPVTSHTISAFLQTPHRFCSKSALYRFGALAITDRSSDNKPLGFQRIERGVGSVEIKSATYHIWLAACAARKDNEVKAWYGACLKANGGNTTKARLSTQRKILHTLWALWLNRTPYEKERFRYNASDHT
jgi:hypothetical protein